ncbi:Type IV secretory pathway protein [Thiorhodovibrio winogradskyi]|uniref:Type IV secretory pathway protein n=1 Tax=Thiorhodovibrio winogradskyi TaxID=77007 RepID=A0ABZ0SAL4_9GAMM|nr:type IV secretion system DNA-binding domain-containing protein [Thiorhodovibrio winogradskyi]
MNLFNATLTDYVTSEWDRVLSDPGGPREARFIVQSLAPDNTFAFFEALEQHADKWRASTRIECHFRVATGLWEDWYRGGRRAELDQDMKRLGGVGEDGERRWIDQDDRLTWYRNRTRSAGDDGLVVVLVGLNHASDQGGLASFHCVDESRIWQAMGQCFLPWVHRLNEDFALEATPSEMERLDAVLQELFAVRPRQLERLAGFLEAEVIQDGRDLFNLTEVTERFYAALPFWNIPPFFDIGSAKASRAQITAAADFISHRRFKSKAEQKKAVKKLEDALANGGLAVPRTCEDLPLYETAEDYLDTLKTFICDGDTQARDQLLQTDLGPVLKLLKQRESKPKAPKKPTRLKRLSLESLLEAVWQTLKDVARTPGEPLWEQLQGIRIEVQSFQHDLKSDDSGGVGANLLAQELLQSCLGGLPELFEGLELRLPVDSDQAERSPSSWERVVPIRLHLPLAEGDEPPLKYGTSRARPHLQFKVFVDLIDDEEGYARPFQWALEPTAPERVLIECARTVLARWNEAPQPHQLLPAFRIPDVEMTALFYAADAEEANRLVGHALNQLELLNLFDGLSPAQVDAQLWEQVLALSAAYRTWLTYCVEQGFYRAMADYFLPLLQHYQALAARVLDPRLLGSQELLNRLYKAFLLVDRQMAPQDGFLHSALVLGISPPVLELMAGRLRFLGDGFPEVAAALVLGREADAAFGQLLKLVEMHRPLAGLVVDQHKHLSAEIKSFGLLHYLGEKRATAKSLAVQTLLRDEESDDDDDVSDSIAATEEQEIVLRVLEDYLQLYPFAEDGLRILALHVAELGTILSGVHLFLKRYLKKTSKDWPAFHCEVMVYTTSSSPMAMENRLAAWRHQVAETYRESGRPLVLSVGHRYAPGREAMIERLGQEARLYDIAFLFRFLEGQLAGETEPALPFAFDFNATNIGQFPISEYPRPIRATDPTRRQSLLSNRRLRIQTHHADLSARLRHPQNGHRDHLVFGRIDYTPWQPVVQTLHRHAQWVACIDPFIDKQLLRVSEHGDERKIVGFTSGLGDYGELNLSISTEQDTLKALAERVHGELIELLPYQDGPALQAMSARVVAEAEEIIGLSSLRAVVGQGERIREVVGFAAIRRALAAPPGTVSQLLPADALLHWFADSAFTHRPDLLQLSLELRGDDLPLVHATVIECKFALHNPVHLAHASDQVQDGLAHLTQLFAPNRDDLHRYSFDRRYWWAQLQRALASRVVVNLPEQAWLQLDQALENLAEGYFEIAWQGALFTFWTNEPGAEPVLTPLALPAGVIRAPLRSDDDFVIYQVALGHVGLMRLFDETAPLGQIDLGDAAARVRATAVRAGSGEAEVPPLTAEAGAEAALAAAETGRRDNVVSLADRPGFRTVPPRPPRLVSHRPLPDSRVADPYQGNLAVAYPADQERDAEREPPLRIESVVAASAEVPERLLLGTKADNTPVYWHYGHERLPNRHLLAFGSSGSGKTYAIQCLLAEMAAQRQHALIVDYTDGFLPGQVAPLFETMAAPHSHFVRTAKLPLNPFRRQQLVVDPNAPPVPENPYEVATRVASIFSSVYESMGDQQFSTLVSVLEAGVSSGGGFSLSCLPERLRDHNQYGVTLASKLEPLIKADPFREGDGPAWQDMLADPEHWVQILQLKSLGREIQKLVTEFALWDLYDYAGTHGSTQRPIPVVLDEIQNLDHRPDSPIDKMLREGRKFGLSLILATQTTSNFNNEQRDRLFQAAHKLFFKPADTEIDRFATLLGQITSQSKADWAQRLAQLKRGYCWSLGPVETSSGALKTVPLLVKVSALEERVFDASN